MAGNSRLHRALTGWTFHPLLGFPTLGTHGTTTTQGGGRDNYIMTNAAKNQHETRVLVVEYRYLEPTRQLFH